jgi:hypothetical protein
MSEQTTPSAPALDALINSWPTYALRGWLAAIEAARLRAQLERATPVIESLQQSIRKVDDVLRHRRDVDRAFIATREARTMDDNSSHSETSRSETSLRAGPQEKHESGGRGKHKR